MKKSIFCKAIVAMTVLAGFTLTSCDKEDNAVIIDGKAYYKSEVIKTDEGATVKGTTPSDISRLLSQVREDIEKKVEAGKDYVITIETPAPIQASESDYTITVPVPWYDTTTGGKIVLKFPNGISTEAPLKLAAKGYSDGWTYGNSFSKIEINIPSASSGASLELSFPYSTVTLKPASGSLTIDKIKSVTSQNTLIIGKGVTVNWLLNDKYSSAIVMKGGKVNGFMADGYYSSGYFEKKGITNRTYNYDEEAEDHKGKPYYSQNLKVLKNEDNNSVNVQIDNDWDYDEEKAKAVEPIIVIEEGAKASIWFNRHEIEVQDEWGTHWEPQCEPFVASITGEGKDAMLVSGDLRSVNLMKNVTIQSYGMDLPKNAEDCTFKSNAYDPWGGGIYFNTDGTFDTSSFTNCKFGVYEEEGNEQKVADYNLIKFNIPVPEKKPSFNWIFDNCEFVTNTQFAGGAYGDPEKYAVTITLDNCKMNGKALTNKNLLNQIWSEINPKNPQPVYDISSKLYVPSYDEKTGKWSLIEKK